MNRDGDRGGGPPSRTRSPSAPGSLDHAETVGPAGATGPDHAVASRDQLISLGGTPILPWQTLEETTLADCRVFSVKRVRRRSNLTGRPHDFFVLHGENWVNVIPVTPDERVILVRQYRQGTREVTLEIPGGVIESAEAPSAAAARELLEETGFAAEQCVELGYVYPNPAIQVNRCYTFLAIGAHRIGEQSLDGSEEIEVMSVPMGDLRGLVAGGAIRHALVVAAFYWFELYRAGLAGRG